MSGVDGYKYAVQLLFDAVSEERIISIINGLRAKGLVNDAFVPEHYRPHISLACYRNMDEAFASEAIGRLAQAMPAFPVRFSCTLMFHNDMHALCYGMPTDRHLARIHRLAHEAFARQPEPCWEHYLADAWNPHCGILVDTRKEPILDGAALLAEMPLPTVEVRSICVTGFKSRIEFRLSDG